MEMPFNKFATIDLTFLCCELIGYSLQNSRCTFAENFGVSFINWFIFEMSHHSVQSNSEPSSLTVLSEGHTTEDFPHVCRQCDRVFPQACRLRAHLKKHTGQRDFTCAVCGKQFALSYQLRLHNRTHTGERPYECITCGKTFARSHNLHQHLRSHRGEKPFGCVTCGKHFTQMKTLRDHHRTHTGVKPFECSTCGRSFGRVDNLKVRHILKLYAFILPSKPFLVQCHCLH